MHLFYHMQILKKQEQNKQVNLGNRNIIAKPARPEDPINISEIGINVDQKDKSKSEGEVSSDFFTKFHYDSEFANNYFKSILLLWNNCRKKIWWK